MLERDSDVTVARVDAGFRRLVAALHNPVAATR